MRNTYVILGLVLIGIFIVFIISKIPQSKDEGNMPSIADTFKTLSKSGNYAKGVLAQICCVGAQIIIWIYIYQYAEGIGIDGGTAVDFQIVTFILFVVGRAIGIYLLRFISSGTTYKVWPCEIILVLGIQDLLGLYALVGVSFLCH
ncbi:MAG: FHS family L-fucose permease-like MFS transporter [Glaciecola sp.]|jgi:FHS family L-fucose permease-like MFS transporter